MNFTSYEQSKDNAFDVNLRFACLRNKGRGSLVRSIDDYPVLRIGDTGDVIAVRTKKRLDTGRHLTLGY